MNIDRWLHEGKYLPEILQDFHAQKDCFKAIHRAIAVDKHNYCKDVDWVAGHCYVVDIFLWFMAKRGYTLQRSRKKFQFNDFDADILAWNNVRIAEFQKLLNDAEPTSPPAT